MHPSRSAALAVMISLAAFGCSSDSNGPTEPRTIQAAGTYDATFAANEATGCEGFVETGSTTGTVTVTQSDGQATLRLTDVTEFIENDPEGFYNPSTGSFSFDGVIVVGNEQGTVNANGTIEGAFTQGGAMNLQFDFTAFTCVVRGTITGQRS